MSAPHPLNLSAYIAGRQPLWRAFWLWSVCGSGSIAWGYYWIEGRLSDGFAGDDWLPLMRSLALWSILGVTSLFVVTRCGRNTTSQLAGMGAFTIVGIPTAFSVFWLLWLM